MDRTATAITQSHSLRHRVRTIVNNSISSSMIRLRESWTRLLRTICMTIRRRLLPRIRRFHCRLSIVFGIRPRLRYWIPYPGSLCICRIRRLLDRGICSDRLPHRPCLIITLKLLTRSGLQRSGSLRSTSPPRISIIISPLTTTAHLQRRASRSMTWHGYRI